MLRTLTLGGTLTILACLGACQNDSRPMSDFSGYTDSGRLDANGIRVDRGARAASAERSPSRRIEVPLNTMYRMSPVLPGQRADVDAAARTGIYEDADGQERLRLAPGDRVYLGNPGSVLREGTGGSVTGVNGQPATDDAWVPNTWDDRSTVRVSEAELPDAVRATFASYSNGATLEETSKGLWNGKAAYRASVFKNGHPYRIITDADGGFIEARIID
jgi:hypothetical protein